MSTRSLLASALAAAALAILLPAPAGATSAPADRDPALAPPQEESAPPSAVAPLDRDEVLPRDWSSSPDTAVTTSGDATGLHVLRASAADGYQWTTMATLVEPGHDTDQWVGQACVTGSGRRAIVVYAPRGFTNEPLLFERGAFTAVVDLHSGAVTKLPLRTSLAYYNPGCGAGEDAVLTQAGADDLGQTRVHVLNSTTGQLTRSVTTTGQVTSAVPVDQRIVAAAGQRLVELDADGSTRVLADTASVPFHIHPVTGGAVAFLDQVGEDRVEARLLSAEATTTLASGALGGVSLASGQGGRLFLTGEPDATGPLPPHVQRLEVPARAEVSSHGGLALTSVASAGLRDGLPAAASARPVLADPTAPQPVVIAASVTGTGAGISFGLQPGAERPAVGSGQAAPAAAAGSPTDPTDADRTCGVPRNDPRTQVVQPHWRQVEWAADLAVQGRLTVSRPANWKQSGLPAWSPQGMYPSIPLAGGGRVPAQVLLGILAQESNLWQASNHALEGVTGNPLVGNYYGRPATVNPADSWAVDFADADCGYGVAQVTDGMRIGGLERTPTQQRAIAMDYATNIAAGLRILQDKWNQTYDAGMRIHNADPGKVENWFFAVWAYNSGFYPDQGTGEPWGVGWLNNPINPHYPRDRTPFLEEGYEDARHPQMWPYPEKVMGWAAYPIPKAGGNDHGYLQAWWVRDLDRYHVMPPASVFCDESNSCYPGEEFPNTVDPAWPGPCSRADLRCWYHGAVNWKYDCAVTCGHENLRYDTGDPEPADATNYPPTCSTSALPAGALVIDDVPSSVPIVRPGCARAWSSSGSFALRFADDGRGRFPSKIDFHQIGAGFGGHFWFAHTRRSDLGGTSPSGDLMNVTGTWTLNRSLNQWARVLVHIPDHGAHTQQARYDITLGGGRTQSRVIAQRTEANTWVSLGAMRFSGTPRVSLSTLTDDGDGNEDIAWDAIAIVPLPRKPAAMVVALGDSYASGEGASTVDGAAYYRESDSEGDTIYRNACHRSRLTWSRKAFLAPSPDTIADRADRFDPGLDYHLLACSGAQTEQLLPSSRHRWPGDGPSQNAFGDAAAGQYRELSQIDRGFLTPDTTLVTLSIGGNDARFGPVVQHCLVFALDNPCQDTSMGAETIPLRESEPAVITGPVRASILTTLRQIHIRAPNAKIVLMGYPRLLEQDGACVVGIAPSEAQWLNGIGDLLADTEQELVLEAVDEGIPVTFADPRQAFAGRGVCGNPQTVWGPLTAKTRGEPSGPVPPVSQQSFHPKDDGTTIYAEVLNAALREIGL